MKKYLISVLCITIILSAILTGCQTSSGNITDTSSNTSVEQNPNGTTDPSDELPNKYIAVRSVSELERMRGMSFCKDEATLNDYLITVEGGGAESKEDLTTFVSLSDSIPYVKLIDGEITFISYTSSNESTLFSAITLPSPVKGISFLILSISSNASSALFNAP